MDKDIRGKEEGHVARMRRKKDVVDRKIAAAATQRGVLLVNTGNGKGKSSAAFGVAARALGHGLQVAVVQFVKSRTDTGEEAVLGRVPGIRWHVMGEGFTWETQDPERDAAAARAAWETALGYLRNPAIGLVVLDELTYAFKYQWLPLDEVLAAFAARPPMQHVIVTGRAAPDELIAAADTVTEMAMVKHAFRAGVHAMPGMEF
ncbi:MAG: cob(I)yrinic acid a,c-diamide adenosyltransferase [Sulfuritalea sp.]|nr:cob(I)yrinic acid a,c-diamide adenosyltransferase [Sulfuritalea sp.]